MKLLTVGCTVTHNGEEFKVIRYCFFGACKPWVTGRKINSRVNKQLLDKWELK